MANQKIHEYLNTATTVGDNDYFDVDKYDGVNYTTSKISGATLKSAIGGGIYSQTTEGTDQTGTTGVSILSGTGVGTLSVPANGFAVGDTFEANLCGIMSNINNEDVSFKILGGPTSNVNLLLKTTKIKLTTNKVFTLKVKFVIRAIGAAGVASIATYFELIYNDDSVNLSEVVVDYNENATTFDTTVLNVLDIHVYYGTSSGSNKCRSELFTLHKVF